MGEDNIKLTGGAFFDLDTGEKIGDLSFDSVEYEAPQITAERQFRMDTKGGLLFEINTEINVDLLNKLSEPLPEKYDIEVQIPVQRRRHKKKRINKKWAKQYGYTMKTITTKGWKIHTDTDGNVEFIKDEISKEEIIEFKTYGNGGKNV